MKRSVTALCCAAAIYAAACSASSVAESTQQTSGPGTTAAQPGKPIGQHTVKTQSKYPSVGLSEYTLITDDLERDRAEAEAVIQTKIGLTRAMQTKERADFERVLGKNFIFRAYNEFFDRAGYIDNRVGDPVKVKQADYRNVVIQFIDGLALVTYSNIVEDEPGGPGAWKADMTWADVLEKVNGEWKYRTIHEIAFKDLTTPAKAG